MEIWGCFATAVSVNYPKGPKITLIPFRGQNQRRDGEENINFLKDKHWVEASGTGVSLQWMSFLMLPPRVRQTSPPSTETLDMPRFSHMDMILLADTKEREPRRAYLQLL